jgi:hypothetical protein
MRRKMKLPLKKTNLPSSIQLTKKEKEFILPIESIPMTSWGVSLSNKLDKDKWDKLRREVYAKAGHSCEVCKTTSEQLNAHESWAFNEKSKIQYLARIRCLCKTCHEATHYFRSSVVFKLTYTNYLKEHLMKINKITETEFERYLAKLTLIVQQRSSKFYRVVIGKYEIF